MIEDKEWTVYMHTAPNGKKYVGITSQKPERRWGHGSKYKKNKHFYNAIKKYGWNNFEHKILCSGLNVAQAGCIEQTFIRGLDLRNPANGYNNSIGGEYGSLGVHPSAETRRKISESNKGKHRSPETCRKISEAFKGKHRSPETRQKISEANKGRMAWNKGVHPSAETRRKLSEASKGRHFSAETRQKISESNKRAYLNPELRRKLSEAHKGANNPYYGKHHSAETRQKISEAKKGKIPWNKGKKGQISCNKKAVICIETGILYSSATEAGKSIGVTRKAISNVLCGKSKTSGGYHWKYVEEQS